MSILLYCITEQSESSDVGPGVAGLPVLVYKEAGLDAMFSRNTRAESWTGASLKRSAREFHNVLHRAFSSRTIVPFRFPTLMRDEAELAAHLRDNAPEYSAQLQKFERSAQMDISITHVERTSLGTSRGSGAEYLRTRQKRSDELQGVAKQLQQLASETARSWRDRLASDHLRLFALVDRTDVAAFRERLKKLSVPQSLNIRVSGPWPVTEFLELKQR
jgi:hypothetical protein